MRRQFLYAVGVLVAVLIQDAFADDQVSGPKLVCTHDNWNMGIISPTDSVHHVFQLENQGTADLVIENVKACCGASTTLGTNVVKAGERTTLTLSMSVKGMTSIQKSLYVKSNDPNQIYYQLQIVGTIGDTATTATAAASYSIPDKIDLGNLLADGTASGTASFYPTKATASDGMVPIVVSTDVPWLKASWEAGSNGAFATVKVDVVPPIAEGRQSGLVILKRGADEETTIPVTCQILPELFCEPEFVTLPKSGGTTAYTRYVTIRTRGKEFSVTNTTKTNLADEVQIDSMVLPGAGYRLTLSQIKPGEIQESAGLVIETDCKNTPHLEIPIRVE